MILFSTEATTHSGKNPKNTPQKNPTQPNQQKKPQCMWLNVLTISHFASVWDKQVQVRLRQRTLYFRIREKISSFWNVVLCCWHKY